VLIASFIAWEHKAPEPVLPPRLFRNSAFSAANATSFLMAGALYAGSIYISQYFQSGRGASPLTAGLQFLPMMAMPLVVAPLAGALSERIGQRVLIVSGLVIEAAGLIWIALIATTTVPYLQLAGPLSLTGTGFSMALMTAPTAALGAVPPQDMGLASGTNGTLQRFGSAVARPLPRRPSVPMAI
jgi:MFS family permease